VYGIEIWQAWQYWYQMRAEKRLARQARDLIRGAEDFVNSQFVIEDLVEPAPQDDPQSSDRNWSEE
jgi:hypothetical protein